ncbi:DHHC palmitoyltransferase-domain-containing protein [Abortiporus biennis]|nr:DHHC palmitoyltransferase-domain-containing protein [Abortiporus biennis]
MGRILDRLFVVFTLCLISFIAYSSQIFIIWPWYGRELTVELLTLLLPFNLLVAMLLWNYYLSVTTDPGRVPKGWQPNAQEGYEVKKLTRGPRYCRNCDSYKPPRAHHCKQCKRCVLRMDHHCPWVNNCVGHYNYGHFIRFLFYVDVACSYHLWMVTRRVLSTSAHSYWDEPSGLELIFIILNYTTCVPVLLAVGGFSLYHFYCLLGNSTTIEGWEKNKAATLLRRGKIREIKFPYNLGWKRNIASVLGNNPLMWCFPNTPSGDGLKYPLADGQNSDDDMAWPPKDPNAYVYPDEDPNYQFKLPDSPWTYENGTLNPNLSTNLNKSNSQLRNRSHNLNKPKPKVVEGTSIVPPYHPDYREPGEDDSDIGIHDDTSSEDDYYQDEEGGGQPRSRIVRRGSEGLEARPIDREEILRRYVDETIHEPGRYNVYVPEPLSESEEEEEQDETEDSEDQPLAEKVEAWIANTVQTPS